jgi:hypothetical protein
MRPAEVDASALAVVIGRLPGEFGTRDVSEAAEMMAAHPGADGDSGFHAVVGRRLSADRLELGIVEASKSGKRGSTWHKKQEGLPEGAVRAASHESEAPIARSRRPPTPAALASGLPAWNDVSLQVLSDSPRMARYRLLQSWYREVVLGAPPAPVRGRLVGSMLGVAAVSERPGLNFLNDAAVAHARSRIAAASRERLTLSAPRLLHNMLSSMPMCFNIFGALGSDGGFLELFRRCFDPEVVSIDAPICEWNPSRSRHPLGDRTAFDALVTYRAADGTRRFIGFETKYTEPFSQKEYTSVRYTDTAASCSWFNDPAAACATLRTSSTNQLWRNLLLAAGLEIGGMGEGSVVVVCAADDPAARTAVMAVGGTLREADRRIHMVTLEDLIAAASQVGGRTASWGERFAERYLDPQRLQPRRLPR